MNYDPVFGLTPKNMFEKMVKLTIVQAAQLAPLPPFSFSEAASWAQKHTHTLP